RALRGKIAGNRLTCNPRAGRARTAGALWRSQGVWSRPMRTTLLAAALAAASTAALADYRVDMNAIDARGVGAAIGTVAIADDGHGGIRLTPDLKGLPPGEHGFHIHEFPNCGAREKDGKPSAGELAG